ncbi:MAG: signal peptidase II [Clostridia bacterium]|nr:signal peptidase II [Clostridia bacterium]
MKNNKKISISLVIAIFSLLFVADILTKYFTVGIDKTFIPGFVKFLYTENTGAAWSIFAGSQRILIIIASIAVLIIILYIILSKSNSKLLYTSLGFILAGAVGNLFDRIVFGYVRDFIKFEFMSFPIFNVADIALTFGVIMMSIYLFSSMIDKSSENGK